MQKFRPSRAPSRGLFTGPDRPLYADPAYGSGVIWAWLIAALAAAVLLLFALGGGPRTQTSTQMSPDLFAPQVKRVAPGATPAAYDPAGGR